jgi:3-oxoacyl-[acyl-carrier protein] reductase
MLFSNRFNGRGAIVTGGASGIGLSVVERIVAEGGKVSIWDINQASIDQAIARLGTAVSGVALDISDPQAVALAAIQSAETLGSIDILVCSAGITGPNVPVVDYPVDDWKRVIDINLNGLFYCNRAVAPHMVKAGYGRIVNVASVAGKEGNPNASAYSTSKAGVIGLTKSLGKELAKTGVIVNTLTPAAVDTPIFAQMTEAHINFMLSKIPMGRFGQIPEVAAMITWLASEECSFTTGAVFDISGGRATY